MNSRSGAEAMTGSPSRSSHKASVRALAPEAQNRDFRFWFSTTSEASREGLERREIFAEVEEHVAHLETQSGGRLQLHFDNGAFSLLAI